MTTSRRRARPPLPCLRPPLLLLHRYAQRPIPRTGRHTRTVRRPEWRPFWLLATRGTAAATAARGWPPPPERVRPSQVVSAPLWPPAFCPRPNGCASTRTPTRRHWLPRAVSLGWGSRCSWQRCGGGHERGRAASRPRPWWPRRWPGAPTVKFWRAWLRRWQRRRLPAPSPGAAAATAVALLSTPT